jgi:hypothetical protein
MYVCLFVCVCVCVFVFRFVNALLSFCSGLASNEGDVGIFTDVCGGTMTIWLHPDPSSQEFVAGPLLLAFSSRPSS